MFFSRRANLNERGIKTLHLFGDLNTTKVIKDLFKRILFNDPDFHYFLEGSDLIIRIKNPTKIKKIKEYAAEDKGISLEIYDYPFPGENKYGDDKKSITVKYFDLYLAFNHFVSVASLSMTKKETILTRDKIYHAFNNQLKYSQFDETLALLSYAYKKTDWLAELLSKDLGKREVDYMMKGTKNQ